jgi:hypothetical protein
MCNKDQDNSSARARTIIHGMCQCTNTLDSIRGGDEDVPGFVHKPNNVGKVSSPGRVFKILHWK